MSTPRIALPGPSDNADAIAHATSCLADDAMFVPGWAYKVGGMEHITSPFLLLEHADGRRLFILERRNDDGEWAALVYPAPADLDVHDSTQVMIAAGRIGEWDDELDPVDAGLTVNADDAHDAVGDLLYRYRDIVSPDALL